ncbi:MAG: O-antigen ligase family protein [Planctomycetaceae bacterium]
MHILNTILVATIALSGLNFAVQQSPQLLQLLIPVIVGCFVVSLVRQVLLNDLLPISVGRFLATSLIASIVYGGCVLAYEGNLMLIMNVDFLKVMGRFSLIPCAFLFSYLQDWKSKSLQLTVSAAFAGVLCYLTFRKLTGDQANGLVVENFHSNILGIMGVVGVFYGWLFYISNKNIWISNMIVLPGIAATLISQSRGAWLCLVLFAVFFLIQTQWRLQKSVRLAAFPMVIGFCLTTILGYVAWTESEFAQRLSQLSQQTIGKPLDTGRANYWRIAADEFHRSPWVGVGLYSHESWVRRIRGVTFRLSVHSYYWAILHEAGLIGLMAVVALFGNIWHLIASGRRQDYSYLTLAFFAAILIQQISEVALSTGTYTVGASIWVAIAAGTSLANDASGTKVLVHLTD